MSVQRASVSKVATQLLHLREADCPGLRAHLAQLDVSWSQLTSDLSKIQDRLQQVYARNFDLSISSSWTKALHMTVLNTVKAVVH